MCIASTIKNSKDASLQNFIVIGHTHRLEEAWLLVLFGRPHQSPLLALHSNLTSNGFLQPMPNPPTQPCCVLRQQYPLLPIVYICNRHFLTLKIQRGFKTCHFICCFFHSQFLTFVLHGQIAIPIQR